MTWHGDLLGKLSLHWSEGRSLSLHVDVSLNAQSGSRCTNMWTVISSNERLAACKVICPHEQERKQTAWFTQAYFHAALQYLTKTLYQNVFRVAPRKSRQQQLACFTGVNSCKLFWCKMNVIYFKMVLCHQKEDVALPNLQEGVLVPQKSLQSTTDCKWTHHHTSVAPISRSFIENNVLLGQTSMWFIDFLWTAVS